MVCCTKSPVLFSVVAAALFHHEKNSLHASNQFFESIFHREFSIFPLRSHVTVSLQQYRRAFKVWRYCVLQRANLCGRFLHHAPFNLFFFSLPVWTVECFTSSNAKATKSLLSFRVRFFLFFDDIHSSSPAQAGAILSQTHPRLCHPNVCFQYV